MDLVVALGAALAGVAAVAVAVEVHRNQKTAQVKTSLSIRGCIAAAGVGMVGVAATKLGWHVAAALLAAAGVVVVASAVATDHRTEAAAEAADQPQRDAGSI